MAAEQRATAGATRVRRLLSRTLLVLGGTVAGTAAAWLLSTACAAAAPSADGEAHPVARTSAERPPTHSHGIDLPDAPRLAPHHPAHRLTPHGPQVAEWRLADRLPGPWTSEPGARPTVPVTGSGAGPGDPAAGYGDCPGEPVASSDARPVPAPRLAPPLLADAVTGPVAGALDELTRPAVPALGGWLAPAPGAPNPRPGIDQVAGALRDAFGGGQLAAGGLVPNPVETAGGLAQSVPGAAAAGESMAAPPVPAVPTAPSAEPATAVSPDGWTGTATTVPAPRGIPAHRSTVPAPPPAPLAPGGPPVIVPVSSCACGSQGSASSGGHPAGATASPAHLPGTALARALRPGAQSEPAASGAQPGVTPD
ncbi:hypothetical protein [Gandjariella thermophila]|uniref:Uncharacterized protein n=1 Tax=Gandjariella thermophila TaxID=1931992 RepID=A0A4D4J7C0_9PSEU|nr:hypothetical protein [Gandjariella thermophila]GDY30900.1 hypothetical protein GTS_25330 [Gandjariella thermophila]